MSEIRRIADSSEGMSLLEAYLLDQDSVTYNSYYNGKMSFAFASQQWIDNVKHTFPGVSSQQTSENIFKDVIDLYVSNLMPTLPELKGFGDTLVPLLCRGEAPVLVLADGTVSFPESFDAMTQAINHGRADYFKIGS